MYKWKKSGITWIAMLAMLVATFMPSMSAAFAPAPEIPISWQSICSQEHETPHLVSQQPVSSDHNGHFDHCPLCLKQGHAVDLLQAATPDFTKPVAVSIVIAVHDEPPSPSFTWTFHPARAPPAQA